MRGFRRTLAALPRRPLPRLDLDRMKIVARAKAVDVEDAVQMVGLVKHALRAELLALDDELLSGDVECDEARLDRALEHAVHPAHRQAAFARLVQSSLTHSIFGSIATIPASSTSMMATRSGTPICGAAMPIRAPRPSTRTAAARAPRARRDPSAASSPARAAPDRRSAAPRPRARKRTRARTIWRDDQGRCATATPSRCAAAAAAALRARPRQGFRSSEQCHRVNVDRPLRRRRNTVEQRLRSRATKEELQRKEPARFAANAGAGPSTSASPCASARSAFAYVSARRSTVSGFFAWV